MARPPCDSRIQEFGVLGHTPGIQQPAHDDATIKEICQVIPRNAVPKLEWKSAQTGVPRGSSQKARRAEPRLQICRISSALMKEQQRAERIASNLRGYAGVLPEIRFVIPSHTTACLLDSGLQEPAAGRFDERVGR